MFAFITIVPVQYPGRVFARYVPESLGHAPIPDGPHRHWDEFARGFNLSEEERRNAAQLLSEGQPYDAGLRLFDGTL